MSITKARTFLEYVNCLSPESRCFVHIQENGSPYQGVWTATVHEVGEFTYSKGNKVVHVTLQARISLVAEDPLYPGRLSFQESRLLEGTPPVFSSKSSGDQNYPLVYPDKPGTREMLFQLLKAQKSAKEWEEIAERRQGLYDNLIKSLASGGTSLTDQVENLKKIAKTLVEAKSAGDSKP